MKKRVISLVCCIALVAALLPVGVLAADENTVVEFGGEKFDMIQGFHYSTSSQGSPTDFDAYLPFFYSDGYFEEDPKIENKHLATMSMDLAASSNYAVSGVDFVFRHGAVRQLLVDIGCDEESIFVNDAFLVPGETYSIGYMIGQKRLLYSGGEETGYKLVTIVPRSAGLRYGVDQQLYRRPNRRSSGICRICG